MNPCSACGIISYSKQTMMSGDEVCLVPRPHTLTKKRVWWLLSASLVVPSQQSWISLWRSVVSFNGLFWINTANSEQPRKRSILTRPFSLWGWGLGTRLGNGMDSEEEERKLNPWSLNHILTSSEKPPFLSGEVKHFTATIFPFHLAFFTSPNWPRSKNYTQVGMRDKVKRCLNSSRKAC